MDGIFDPVKMLKKAASFNFYCGVILLPTSLMFLLMFLTLGVETSGPIWVSAFFLVLGIVCAGNSVLLLALGELLESTKRIAYIVETTNKEKVELGQMDKATAKTREELLKRRAIAERERDKLTNLFNDAAIERAIQEIKEINEELDKIEKGLGGDKEE